MIREMSHTCGRFRSSRITNAGIRRLRRHLAAKFRHGARLDFLLEIVGVSQERGLFQESAVHPDTRWLTTRR